MAHRTQKNHLLTVYWFTIEGTMKDTDEHPQSRDAQSKAPGNAHRASMTPLDTPVSLYLHMFTDLEALRTSYYWGF